MIATCTSKKCRWSARVRGVVSACPSCGRPVSLREWRSCGGAVAVARSWYVPRGAGHTLWAVPFPDVGHVLERPLDGVTLFRGRCVIKWRFGRWDVPGNRFAEYRVS